MPTTRIRGTTPAGQPSLTFHPCLLDKPSADDSSCHDAAGQLRSVDRATGADERALEATLPHAMADQVARTSAAVVRPVVGFPISHRSQLISQAGARSDADALARAGVAS
jgi:hypothetical protein